MKRIFAAAVIATGMLATSAQADLIAYWNFNTFDPNTDTILPADAGTGTIDLSGWGGDVANFNGNSTNALFGDPAGASLSLQGGTDVEGNGTYIDVTFSMSGLQDLEISYWTRRTGTGFDANQWSYSTNGVDFFDFGPLINPIDDSGGELIVLAGAAALNDAASVTIRYTLDGATSASGNNRIDNLQLNANVIPAPGALALLAVAGLAAGRRRRSA